MADGTKGEEPRGDNNRKVMFCSWSNERLRSAFHMEGKQTYRPAAEHEGNQILKGINKRKVLDQEDKPQKH